MLTIFRTFILIKYIQFILEWMTTVIRIIPTSGIPPSIVLRLAILPPIACISHWTFIPVSRLHNCGGNKARENGLLVQGKENNKNEHNNTNQSTNQPIDQACHQSINQSIDRNINKSKWTIYEEYFESPNFSLLFCSLTEHSPFWRTFCCRKKLV